MKGKLWCILLRVLQATLRVRSYPKNISAVKKGKDKKVQVTE